MQVIDDKGYRASVGVIIINDSNRVFWAKRVGQDAWQFPQGGLQEKESAVDAMYRELYEEVGLQAKDVQIVAETDDWLYYDLPERFIRYHSQPLCVGQKQKWYLLKLVSAEDQIRFDVTQKPEFEQWRWVYYWYPLKKVINFKRDVYRGALRHFETKVFPGMKNQ